MYLSIFCCYNQIPEARYFIKKTGLVQVLEADSPSLRGPINSDSGEDPWALSQHSRWHCGRGTQEKRWHKAGSQRFRAQVRSVYSRPLYEQHHPAAHTTVFPSPRLLKKQSPLKRAAPRVSLPTGETLRDTFKPSQPCWGQNHRCLHRCHGFSRRRSKGTKILVRGWGFSSVA